jgi:lipopolysaccharide transport system permease protein
MNAVGMSKALWRYRGFVTATVVREFQLRYRGSALGFIWNLIQPIGTVFIFTVVFAQIMQARLPGVNDVYGYGVYLCSGMFVWGMFGEIVQRGLNMFIDFGNMLKKSSFPRSSVPLIIVLSALLNFCLTFGIFLAFLAIIGRFPGAIAFAALPVIAVFLMFAVGLAVFLGTLNVFLRDIGQAVVIILQFWFWLTPIVYPEKALPDFAHDWLKLNPAAPLIAAMHDIFVDARMPDWSTLVLPIGCAAAALALAALTFRAYSGEGLDEQ